MPLVITIALLTFVLVMIALFSLHSGQCERKSRTIHRLRDLALANPRFLQ